MGFLRLAWQLIKMLFGGKSASLDELLQQQTALGRVLDAFTRGDYPAALQINEEMRGNPAVYHFFRGELCAQLGRSAEAEAAFREGVKHEKDPRQIALAHSALGQLLMRMGRSEEAVACFEESLRHWPDRGSSYRDLAEVFLRKGDPASALGHARRAVEMERRGAGLSAETKAQNLGEDLATLAWAVARSNGALQEVEQLVEEAAATVAGAPVVTRAQVHTHAGIAYEALGQSEKSLRHFDQAARIDEQGLWGRAARELAGR